MDVLAALCERLVTDDEPLFSLSARLRVLAVLRGLDRAAWQLVRERAVPHMTQVHVRATWRAWHAGQRPPTALDLAHDDDAAIAQLEHALACDPLHDTTVGRFARPERVRRLLQLGALPGLWALVPLKLELRRRRAHLRTVGDVARHLRLPRAPLQAPGMLRGRFVCHEDCLDVALRVHGSSAALQRRHVELEARAARAAATRATKAARRAELHEAADLLCAQAAEAESEPRLHWLARLDDPRDPECFGWQELLGVSVHLAEAQRRYEASGRPADRAAALDAFRAARADVFGRARWVSALPLPRHPDGRYRRLVPPGAGAAAEEYLLFACDRERGRLQALADGWAAAAEAWRDWATDLGRLPGPPALPRCLRDNPVLAALQAPQVWRSVAGLLADAFQTAPAAGEAGAGAGAAALAAVRERWRGHVDAALRHNAALVPVPETGPHWALIDQQQMALVLATLCDDAPGDVVAASLDLRQAQLWTAVMNRLQAGSRRSVSRAHRSAARKALIATTGTSHGTFASIVDAVARTVTS